MSMKNGTNYTGGCACGAIRYEIAAEPMMAMHCQCRACQKATGGGHASAMAFPRAAAKLTGTPKYYESPADSGNIARRGFCTNCGSLVVGESSGMPDMLITFVGSLDDPSRFSPKGVVYHASAQAWDFMNPTLPTFPAMPPPPV